MKFKDFFNERELLAEYKVNISNGAEWSRLIPKQLDNISKLIGLELNSKFPWFIFNIDGQEYICGYITINHNFTFFNLTQAIEAREISLADLSVLSKNSIIKFINTICSILEWLSRKNINKFVFQHDDKKRTDLYLKFLEKSLPSFLPEFKVMKMDKRILLYRPLGDDLRLDESFKGEIFRRDEERGLSMFRNFKPYTFQKYNS